MDSALIITNMDNPLQHLRSVSVEDLPPNEQACNVCAAPWGFSKDADGPTEHPVIPTCGCIAGSLCLERSFERSPRCPLCKMTIRIIPGVNAPLNPGTSSHLHELELKTGVNDWPIPSIESRQDMPDRASMEQAEQLKYDLQEKLSVLNGYHGTFLSIRELEVCISLIDYRLDTRTSTADFLDGFMKHPLSDPSRWEKPADVRAYMEGNSNNQHEGESGVENPTDGDLSDVLILVNMRAGTSFLLDELKLVVSLMNFLHQSGVGLLDVLGLRDGELYGRPEVQLVDQNLVQDLGTLDMRVGSKNAVADLRDRLSQVKM